MSDPAQFDPSAFMANRQKAAQPATTKAVNPPGGKDPAAVFDPNKFMADRNFFAPARAQQQAMAPSANMAKVGNTLFEDAANAPRRILDGLSNHPVDSAVQTLQDFTQARQAHLQRASDAWKTGDYQTAAVQGFFGSVPFLGPMLGAAADEWTGGHKPEATAHAIETLLPFLHDPAMAGLESQAAARLGRAADVTAAGMGGAVSGGLKGGLSLEKFRGIPTVPKALVGGVRGEITARALNAIGVPVPPGAGGIVGAAVPVLQGAYRGARRAIAEKMVGPEVLDALAQLKHGKGYGSLEEAQKGDILTAAQNATGKKPGLPSEVQQELTRPSEVPTALPAQPEAVPPAAAQPVPVAPTVPQVAPQAPATPTPPEAPPQATGGPVSAKGEPFATQARGLRAANAETLSQALSGAGKTSAEVRGVRVWQWPDVAKQVGVDFPVTHSARLKLIRDTLARLQQKESKP